uniref:G-protein coupled receptors family 1 profile domain-containing protein n=1 Tax=Timema monikensis TaxID=170555 RepID=A0A7R9EE32_9NEOP|nr:unnamed protein product [Timema monikensis]
MDCTNNVSTNDSIGNSIQPQNKTQDLSLGNLSLVILLCIVIVITVIGNTMIIISVLTTRRLRTVTNCFVMSLAVADWLVGIFVMPPQVADLMMGITHIQYEHFIFAFLYSDLFSYYI